MSVGALVAAVTGIPAGRFSDPLAKSRTTVVGLIGVASGSFALSMPSRTLGIPGYLAPLVVITTGYAVFPGSQYDFGDEKNQTRFHFALAQFVTQSPAHSREAVIRQALCQRI